MRKKSLFLLLILVMGIVSIGTVLAACWDSDGGIDRETAGYVVYNGNTYSDYCFDFYGLSYVKDYRCVERSYGTVSSAASASAFV